MAAKFKAVCTQVLGLAKNDDGKPLPAGSVEQAAVIVNLLGPDVAKGLFWGNDHVWPGEPMKHTTAFVDVEDLMEKVDSILGIRLAFNANRLAALKAGLPDPGSQVGFLGNAIQFN